MTVHNAGHKIDLLLPRITWLQMLDQYFWLSECLLMRIVVVGAEEMVVVVVESGIVAVCSRVRHI